MPKPRKRQVCLEHTPYYHCVARCVRRAFLCGQDPVTGFSFEHRRQWIVDRMKLLGSVFAVDLCAFAVMSNHYHIVLRINASEALDWSDQEVAERWTRIFSGPLLVRQWLAGSTLSEYENQAVKAIVQEWRLRLRDLSWFMRCLNEPIARLANHEDRCSGRFWEGRFKSQALLDDRAVLACMAYVDLNPIRAAIAATPESSDYTSIKERIRQPDDHVLQPFNDANDQSDALPASFNDYLQLVDWAGRCIHQNKKGFIAEGLPPILHRLQMDVTVVAEYLGRQERFPLYAIGPVYHLRAMANSLGMKFLRGVSLGARLCPERR